MPRGLAGVSLAGAHGHGQFDSDSQGLTKLTRPRVEMCEDKFMAFVERLAECWSAVGRVCVAFKEDRGLQRDGN